MKKLFLFSILWLFIFILSELAHGQTSDKKNIAVIDLENRGSMLREEAKMLTDRLRSALVQTNAFIIATILYLEQKQQPSHLRAGMDR